MTRLLHPLVKELCLEDYKHSNLYSTMAALFDINEVWVALGVDTAQDYYPGCVTGPDPDTTAAMLLQAVEAGDVSLAELATSYRVINRYVDLLRRKGYTLWT